LLRRILYTGTLIGPAGDLTLHTNPKILLGLWLLAAAGCGAGNDDAAKPAQGAPAASVVAPVETAGSGEQDAASAKVGGPISIAYRLIGEPVVGQPLAIELRVASALGDQPVRIDYRILDATALRLPESQAPYATVARTAPDAVGNEQVTVVPLREGRLYLNVAASVDTGEGSISTVTAIPIQVGNVARETRQNGRLATDDAGEAVRVLDGSDDD
jgi:hypothetical protein